MTRKGIIVDLHLIARDRGKILMGIRKNTGFCDGMYHLPAGHLEEGETITSGAIREAKEELAINIDPAALNLVHVMHQREGRLSLFFEVEAWSGQIENAEPDKCESLNWIPWNKLPENSVPYARVALELIASGKNVGTFGWD